MLFTRTRKALLRRELIACALLFVMGANSLAPLVIAAVGVPAGSDGMVLLCTENGLQWVSLDDIGLNEDDTEPRVNCPACLSSADNLDAMECSYGSPALIAEQNLKRSKHADRVNLSLYLHDSPGRAPPISSHS